MKAAIEAAAAADGIGPVTPKRRHDSIDNMPSSSRKKKRRVAAKDIQTFPSVAAAEAAASSPSKNKEKGKARTSPEIIPAPVKKSGRTPKERLKHLGNVCRVMASAALEMADVFLEMADELGRDDE